ncbi:MAG: peptidoglycan recognition family protein, partial [Massilia sp.]
MHHTWRPNRAQYRGHDTIVAMWRFHTEQNHWSDIAQHITIAPDGTIWLGRDWNMPPASASGHNGNAQAGPFMFEMIGDFDEGRDPFDGEQRKTALEVIARVQLRFGLPPGTLQFHNMMSTKTCPGTNIDYQTVLREVSDLHPQLLGGMRAAPPADGAFSPEYLASQRTVVEAIEDLQRPTGRGIDPADAEPCFHGDGHDGADPNTQRDIARGIRNDAADLQAIRPHDVNLN